MAKQAVGRAPSRMPGAPRAPQDGTAAWVPEPGQPGLSPAGAASRVPADLGRAAAAGPGRLAGGRSPAAFFSRLGLRARRGGWGFLAAHCHLPTAAGTAGRRGGAASEAAGDRLCPRPRGAQGASLEPRVPGRLARRAGSQSCGSSSARPPGALVPWLALLGGDWGPTSQEPGALGKPPAPCLPTALFRGLEILPLGERAVSGLSNWTRCESSGEWLWSLFLASEGSELRLSWKSDLILSQACPGTSLSCRDPLCRPLLGHAS